MDRDLQKMSVQEIRHRFVESGSCVSGRILSRLRKDPRRGVQRVWQGLERRRRDQKREDLHTRSLLHLEQVLWGAGVEHVAGVDEVGIGPLAGPVVAAAVMFPPQTFIRGIDDSKKLDPEQRRQLRDEILRHMLACSVAVVDVEEIDRLNIYHAGLEAMRRAVLGLVPPPQHVLVDAREIPNLKIRQNRFDKGDGINFSIAAASILAKTHRDALMDRLHEQYPHYGFNRHKGYSTRQHETALREYGPCAIHRRSFPFVREACGKFSDSFYRLRAELDSAFSISALKAIEGRLESMGDLLAADEVRKLKMRCKRLGSRIASEERSRDSGP